MIHTFVDVFEYAHFFLSDDDGIIIHLDGMLKEITAEIDSSQSTPEIGEAAQNLDRVVILFDLRGELLNINSAGEDLLGIPKEQLLGKSLSEFLAPGDRDLFLIFLAQIPAGTVGTHLYRAKRHLYAAISDNQEVNS